MVAFQKSTSALCYSCGYCRVSTASVGVSEQKDGPFSLFMAVDFVCQWTNDQMWSMKNDMIKVIL